VRSPVSSARAGPSMCERLEADVGVDGAEDGRSRVEAADDARALDQDRRPCRRRFAHDALARHVARADVLGQRLVRELLQRLGSR
jgi:hypothetical protein